MRIQRIQSLFSKGYGVKAIARELYISRGTVYSDL
ncbi:helix-turn-helix domain-containing protein [Peribacillus butanolivorans]